MIRILHSGDLHIGRKYEGYSDDFSKRLHDSRLEALENVVELANSEKCSYLVLAGDIFDSTDVCDDTIRKVCNILSRSIPPVFVIPGNHDYFDKDKDELWKKFTDLMSGNTLLLAEQKPYETKDQKTVFYPCGCNKHHSDTNAIGWISGTTPDSQKLNVGIAHGAIKGLSCNEGDYFPMTESELIDTGLDLWLIGHTHIPYPNGDEIHNRKVFNAGTHQQTDISDNSEGSVFIIDIDDDKKITAKKHPTGAFHFVRGSIEVNYGEKLDDVLDKALTGNLQNTYYRFTISGILLKDDYTNRYNIIEQKRKKVPFLDIKGIDEIDYEYDATRIDAITLPSSPENKLLKKYMQENRQDILHEAIQIIKKCTGG